MAVGLTACGDGSDPVEAGAGAEAAPSAPGEEPGPATEPDAAEPAEGPSPVDGLSAAELRTVVEAPPSPSATGRPTVGPVADQVPVAGRTAWRITIPGTYELLSSRIVVAIGGQDVGEGVVVPDLTALVAVVLDPALVVDGATVTYRWGAGEPIDAGPLEVVR
jgi:hypothetical protein